MALHVGIMDTFNENTQGRDEKIEEMKKKIYGG